MATSQFHIKAISTDGFYYLPLHPDENSIAVLIFTFEKSVEELLLAKGTGKKFNASYEYKDINNETISRRQFDTELRIDIDRMGNIQLLGNSTAFHTSTKANW